MKTKRPRINPNCICSSANIAMTKRVHVAIMKKEHEEFIKSELYEQSKDIKVAKGWFLNELITLEGEELQRWISAGYKVIY